MFIFPCENSKIATLLLNNYPQDICWIPPKKDTPRPRAKEKLQQNGRRGKIAFRMKPIPTRDARRAHTKPCAHQDPETPQRLSQTCPWVFECLLWRYGSAVACCRGRGSAYSRPRSHSLWHKPSWRRSPLTPP